MKTTKPSWDMIWMELAFNIAKRSSDTRLQVGAVIVSCDNESVLSLGYNGDEAGGNNQPDSLEPGKSGFIHAEINAMIKLNYNDTREKKIYLTHSPCKVCARAIINAKIKEVIFDKEYRLSEGIDLLRQRNIAVRKIPHWE